MKRLLPILFFILIYQYTIAQKSNRLDSLVTSLGNSFISDPKTKGLSIGIYERGEIKYYNFGTTEKRKRTLPKQNTIYEIGSITKTFVSLVLVNAILEKKINPDDDIRKYLKGEYPNLEFKGQYITIKSLANTTSEIPNWLPEMPMVTNPDSIPFKREEFNKSCTKEDFYKALKKVKLDTLPGYRTRHSNGAAQLLTYILEDVYNESIDKLVARYILTPAKMKQTKFLASKDNTDNIAKGYDGSDRDMPFFSSSYMAGVGGLNSSAEDLIKYIIYQLGNNKAIQLSHDVSFNAGQYQIGYNWLIYKHENGLKQIWTDGGTYGFCAYLVLYPEINSGIVLLSNASDETIHGKLGDIAYRIFQVLQK